jgi:hypothetical protein
MDKREAIIAFVRGILGCKCPDEVFEQIEDRGDEVRENTPLRTMTIGKRLLVYIWQTNSPTLVRAGLPSMLLRGRNERDKRGLNRFRAVIATDDVEAMSAIANELFKDLSQRDDKVHIHVVRRADVANVPNP